jgi:hypothetical protein
MSHAQPAPLDLLDLIRLLIVASRTASEPAASVQIARARVVFTQAMAELENLEGKLLTREAEWAAANAPPPPVGEPFRSVSSMLPPNILTGRE